MITAVLIITLFYPRLGLIIGYYGHGILPNPFTFWIDFWLAAFVPRLLMLVYIAINWDTLSNSGMWLAFHIIALILANITDDED